jgi:hypothetical protein
MSEKDLHVYPKNDLHPHILDGTDCPCHPIVRVDGEGLLIIHNSWDGREYVEEAREYIEKLNEATHE